MDFNEMEKVISVDVDEFKKFKYEDDLDEEIKKK